MVAKRILGCGLAVAMLAFGLAFSFGADWDSTAGVSDLEAAQLVGGCVKAQKNDECPAQADCPGGAPSCWQTYDQDGKHKEPTRCFYCGGNKRGCSTYINTEPPKCGIVIDPVEVN